MKAPTLVLMRHGESEWNKRNLFTGWVDIPLSFKGIQEAIDGGKKFSNIPIHICFTSSLVRAQTSSYLALSQNKSGKFPLITHPEDSKINNWEKIHNSEEEERGIPIHFAWELNERMYGDLQGLNKDEARARFGKDQIQRWRRSYDEAPPHGESLQMTAARALPYFEEKIVPFLAQGKNVLISAHGNSLRAIVMSLEKLSKEEVVGLEIPTGAPLIYHYVNQTFVKSHEL